MKKLLSRITIALFVTLYACYPVHAGVGDVYYCVPDNLIAYDHNTKKASLKQASKFKFKWTKKYGDDYLEFDDNFIVRNLGMDNVKAPLDDTFSATYGEGLLEDLLFFSDGIFQWSSFADGFESYTLYATCSKF